MALFLNWCPLFALIFPNPFSVLLILLTFAASMKYRVNDIFYSLQGEGRHTGRPALFVRFAGCNLKCPFCDTEFDSYHEFSADYIVTELLAHCIDHGVLHEKPMVVLTGGEPTLQVGEDFIDLLHEEGFYVAMESNGVLPAPRNLDWLTVSPKSARPRKAFQEGGRRPDEIKIVFNGNNDPEKILSAYMNRLSDDDESPKPLLYLQPCDTGGELQNRYITTLCVRYVMSHPKWRLSLQTHKLIGIE